MRHHYGYSKLGKPTDQRIAMLRSLAVALFKNKRVETTEARAKELRKFAERLITRIKKGDLASHRYVVAELLNEKDLVKSLYKNTDQFKARTGGFTRIIKTTLRRGDAAQMALIELV